MHRTTKTAAKIAAPATPIHQPFGPGTDDGQHLARSG
jgi:hypothetical protein